MKHKHKIGLTIVYLIIIIIFTFYFTIYIDLTPEQRDKDMFGKAINWLLKEDLAGKGGSIVSAPFSQPSYSMLDSEFTTFLNQQLPPEKTKLLFEQFYTLQIFGQSINKFQTLIPFIISYSSTGKSITEQFLEFYVPLYDQQIATLFVHDTTIPRTDLVGLGGGTIDICQFNYGVSIGVPFCENGQKIVKCKDYGKGVAGTDIVNTCNNLGCDVNTDTCNQPTGTCQSLYGAPQGGVGCWDGNDITRCHDGKLLLLKDCPNGCQKGTTTCKAQQATSSTLSGKVYLRYDTTPESGLYLYGEFDDKPYYLGSEKEFAELDQVIVKYTDNTESESKLTCSNGKCLIGGQGKIKIKPMSWCMPLTVLIDFLYEPNDVFAPTFSIDLNADNNYFYGSSDWNNDAIHDPYDPLLSNVQCENGKIKLITQSNPAEKLANYAKCNTDAQCSSELCTELTGKTGPIGPYGQSVTSTGKYCIPCNEELDFEDNGLHFYYSKGFMCNQGLGQIYPTTCNYKHSCISCDGRGDYPECVEACKQNPNYKFCIPQGCTDNYCPQQKGLADENGCANQLPYIIDPTTGATTFKPFESKGNNQEYRFVDQSVKLCPGTYQFDKPLIFMSKEKGKDLVLDCQGSTVKYASNTYFTTPFITPLDAGENLIIKNCNFEGFNTVFGASYGKNIAFLNNKFTNVATIAQFDYSKGIIFDGNNVMSSKYTAPDGKVTNSAGTLFFNNVDLVTFINNNLYISGTVKFNGGSNHIIYKNNLQGGYYEFSDSKVVSVSDNTFAPLKYPSQADAVFFESVGNLVVINNNFALPSVGADTLEKPMFVSNSYQTTIQPNFLGVTGGMFTNEEILNEPLYFEDNELANYFISIPEDKIQLSGSVGAFYYTFDPKVLHLDQTPAYFATITVNDSIDKVYAEYTAPDKNNKKIYFGFAKKDDNYIQPKLQNDVFQPDYIIGVKHNTKNYATEDILVDQEQKIFVEDMCFQTPSEFDVMYKYYDFNTQQYVGIIAPKKEQYEADINELKGAKLSCEGGDYKTPCNSDADCLNDEYVCNVDTCVLKSTLGTFESECEQASDCDDGFYCKPEYQAGYFVGGLCLALPDSCSGANDCPQFYTCESGDCVLTGNQDFNCVDSDVGPKFENYAYYNTGVPGIAKGYYPALNTVDTNLDYCVDENNLMEFMCDLNSNILDYDQQDCEHGCVDGYCKQPCSVTQPCPNGFTCFNSGTENYCKPDVSPLDDISCTTNDQCPFPAICENKNCIIPDEIPECTKDIHCTSGEKCENGGCVLDIDTKGKTSCNQDSDCGSGYYCPQYGDLLILPLCTPLPSSCTDDASCNSNNYYCGSDKVCKPLISKTCSADVDCKDSKYTCTSNKCSLKVDKLPTGELYYYTASDGNQKLNVTIKDDDGVKAVLLYYDLSKKEISSDKKESALLIGCFGANVEQGTCGKETNSFTFVVKDGISGVCSQSCSSSITGVIIEDNAGNQYQYYLEKENDFYVNVANDQIKSVVSGHPGVCSCGTLPANYCYTKTANDKQGTCKYSYEFCDIAEKVPICKLKLETCNKDSPFNFCGAGNVCTGNICMIDCSGDKKCPEGLTCASNVCIKSGETCIDNSQCTSSECKNNICQVLKTADDDDNDDNKDLNKKKKKKKDKDCEPKYAQSCYNDAKKQKCINGIQTIKCKPLNDCYRDGGILQITCDTSNQAYGTTKATCTDGIKNQNEKGVDCGGLCAKLCVPLTIKKGTVPQSTLTPSQPKFTQPEFKEASCYDGIQNQGEAGLDCGGPCNACESCFDEIQNQDEEGVDCGGSCEVCSSPWKTWLYILIPVVLVIGLLLMLLIKSVRGNIYDNHGLNLGSLSVGKNDSPEQHGRFAQLSQHTSSSRESLSDIPQVHTSNPAFDNQLQHYIQVELDKGYTKEHIIKNLSSVGWPQEKVEQLFSKEAHTFLPQKYKQQLSRFVTFYKKIQ
ncbi:hypothetical protein HYY69_06835 [Candidatus Woesearchaeota archaeon]|nr:hypothetical protein [Candidatus Woesearchaeota archaeon]